MPKKTKNTIFNFHLRKKHSSIENNEENHTDQDPGPPSSCQETYSLPHTTRAAKQTSTNNVCNISEEKSLNSKVYTYKRKKFLGSDEERKRRLKNLLQSASKPLANESTVKREQRLEDLRSRAKLYREKKKYCGLKIKTVDKINQEYKCGSDQSNSLTAHSRVKQKHSVTNISEFDKCIIEEVVALFHAKKRKLTVQKILDATKRRLHGFNCSYSSMRRILIKLGYKFKIYPDDGKKVSTFHVPEEDDEKSESTELIAEMGRRYMSMLNPKEEYKIEIKVCLENKEI